MHQFGVGCIGREIRQRPPAKLANTGPFEYLLTADGQLPASSVRTASPDLWILANHATATQFTASSGSRGICLCGFPTGALLVGRMTTAAAISTSSPSRATGRAAVQERRGQVPDRLAARWEISPAQPNGRWNAFGHLGALACGGGLRTAVRSPPNATAYPGGARRPASAS